MIPLSRIAHGGYCMRRAALLTNEQLWAENTDTAKGREEHGRVHTKRIERRGDTLLLYEYEVSSLLPGTATPSDTSPLSQGEQ